MTLTFRLGQRQAKDSQARRPGQGQKAKRPLRQASTWLPWSGAGPADEASIFLPKFESELCQSH